MYLPSFFIKKQFDLYITFDQDDIALSRVLLHEKYILYIYFYNICMT